MLCFVFPGQGSQKKGMGQDLFDAHPELCKTANDILGYDIKTLCLDDPEQQLNQTAYTQPALFTVTAMAFLSHIDEHQDWPDYVAGHSLGEYNALYAAGVFDFETGLKLVKKRGELMSLAKGGGMAAVIGTSSKQIEQSLNEQGLTAVGVANYNAPMQTVISGPEDDIQTACQALKNLGTVIPLPVSGAFHSQYMMGAQHQFSEFIESFEFKTPQLPVIANMDARPYHPRVLKDKLVKQITHSVQWVNTVQYLKQYPDMTFVEVGPGQVLTKLVAQI